MASLIRLAAGVTVLSVIQTADLFAESRAAGFLTESDRYRVELSGEGEPWFDPNTGGRVKFTFSVLNKSHDRRYTVYLDNITSKIERVRIFKDKLVVFGEEATLHASITTVISLEDRQEIDSLIGFGNTLSETGRFISYRKFYPAQTAEPPMLSDLVLIYDLNDSADENRLRGMETYKNDPVGRLIEVGHPVYPEGHAGKKHYRVWVRDENNRHAVFPDRFFWLDHDRKIAFGDRVGDETYVVVVDVSSGFSRPAVYKARIDVPSLLKPEDRRDESLVQEAKRFNLESVQEMKNGSIRIRVSSRIPLLEQDIELPLKEAGAFESIPSNGSLQPTDDAHR